MACALCVAQVDAPFAEGEFVFEQGDEGDAFYVITEGAATVLRTEDDSAEEVVLAELGEGAYTRGPPCETLTHPPHCT